MVVAPILPGSDLGIEGFAVADAAAPRGPTTRIASLKNKASIWPSCMSMPTCSTSRPPKPTGNVTSALLHLRSIRWSLPSNATASSHDSPRRQKHHHPRPTLRTADPRIAPVKTVLTTVQSYLLPYRSSGPACTHCRARPSPLIQRLRRTAYVACYREDH